MEIRYADLPQNLAKTQAESFSRFMANPLRLAFAPILQKTQGRRIAATHPRRQSLRLTFAGGAPITLLATVGPVAVLDEASDSGGTLRREKAWAESAQMICMNPANPPAQPFPWPRLNVLQKLVGETVTEWSVGTDRITVFLDNGLVIYFMSLLSWPKLTPFLFWCVDQDSES